MEIINLSEVCRTCLSKTEDMILLESAEDFSLLKQKISTICNFIIEINDILPRFLCRECDNKLRIAYDFQQLSNRSQDFINTCITATQTIQDPIYSEDFINKEESDQAFIVISDDKVIKNKHLSVAETQTELVKKQFSSDNEDIKELYEIQDNPISTLSKHCPEYIHMLIESVKAKFYVERNCLYCSFLAKDSRVLSVHMTRSHREEKEKWCNFCNEHFENINEHVTSVHENENKCPLCDKVCGTTSHFVEHLQRHSEKLHVCTICSKTFKLKDEVRKHLLKHSDAEKNSVLQSNEIAESTNEIKKNPDSENNQEEENEEVENSGKLKKRKSQKYCTQCEKNVRSLNQHNKQHHHETTTKKYGILCTLCGKQFRSESKLSLHLQIHTGEYRHQCSYCNAKLASKSNLVIHERIHTGEKPYICKFCGKGFTQTSVLNVHMKLHTGKPEQCMLCPKKFCRPSELRQHMRTHTGEKPYACTVCGKSFVQKSHLRDHSFTHFSERRYQCGFCDKCFKQIGTLKIHINGHLNGKITYNCDKCLYKCGRKYLLRRHKLEHEKNNISDESIEDIDNDIS